MVIEEKLFEEWTHTCTLGYTTDNSPGACTQKQCGQRMNCSSLAISPFAMFQVICFKASAGGKGLNKVQGG